MTLELSKGLPSLRSKDSLEVIYRCFFEGNSRFGFRLCHFAILTDHIHLLVEAKDRRVLSRALQGLTIRIAKQLNRHWGRKGRFFADRYSDHVLRTPKEVRRALCFVLNNELAHGLKKTGGIDSCTAGPWFDGRKGSVQPQLTGLAERPTVPAKSKLLTTGWRRRGLLSPDEVPKRWSPRDVP